MAHLPPGAFHPSSPALVPTSRPADLRSEQEIAAHILSYRPVTREKNVWAYWNNGWAAMRPWVQRNVVDWVRRLGPDWDVRVLDVVPGSPNNIEHFVDEDMLPKTFKTMDGRHAGQHSSDILRVLLLYLHGGVWIDAGAILTRGLDDIWSNIADPASSVEVVAMATGIGPDFFWEDRPILNTFLAARKGSQFMELWHSVFAEAMRGRTNSRDVGKHPLYAHLAPFALPDWCPVELDVAELADYMGQFHAAGRLFALVDPARGWDGPAFFADKLMLLHVDEPFVHNRLTAYDGAPQFAHLSLARAEPVDRADPAQAAAEAFVETTLAESTLMKMSSGIMPKPVQLAEFWGRAENRGADVAPGTWAEYLRWGSVHLDQTRELVPLSRAEKAARGPKRVWTAGVLEVIDSTTPVRANGSQL